MAGVDRIVEIDAGEDGEHIGLQQRHQQFEVAVSRTTMMKGSVAPNHPSTPHPASMMMNPAKTWSVMWPASMLANRRTLWETGRDRKDRISIATMAGRM